MNDVYPDVLVHVELPNCICDIMEPIDDKTDLENRRVIIIEKLVLINEVAMFKVRAVRNSDDKWEGIVRRVGAGLIISAGKFAHPNTALNKALEGLKIFLRDDIAERLK